MNVTLSSYITMKKLPFILLIVLLAQISVLPAQQDSVSQHRFFQHLYIGGNIAENHVYKVSSSGEYLPNTVTMINFTVGHGSQYTKFNIDYSPFQNSFALFGGLNVLAKLKEQTIKLHLGVSYRELKKWESDLILTPTTTPRVYLDTYGYYVTPTFNLQLERFNLWYSPYLGEKSLPVYFWGFSFEQPLYTKKTFSLPENQEKKHTLFLGVGITAGIMAIEGASVRPDYRTYPYYNRLFLSNFRHTLLTGSLNFSIMHRYNHFIHWLEFDLGPYIYLSGYYNSYDSYLYGLFYGITLTGRGSYSIAYNLQPLFGKMTNNFTGLEVGYHVTKVLSRYDDVYTNNLYDMFTGFHIGLLHITNKGWYYGLRNENVLSPIVEYDKRREEAKKVFEFSFRIGKYFRIAGGDKKSEQ